MRDPTPRGIKREKGSINWGRVMTEVCDKLVMTSVCDWLLRAAWLICAEIFLPIIFLCKAGGGRGQRNFGLLVENIFGASPPRNILPGSEQFLFNETNQVWQIRLCWLQPQWHIYCPGRFETLVNLSFHSYIFTKTVGFSNATAYIWKSQSQFVFANSF